MPVDLLPLLIEEMHLPNHSDSLVLLSALSQLFRVSFPTLFSLSLSSFSTSKQPRTLKPVDLYFSTASMTCRALFLLPTIRIFLVLSPSVLTFCNILYIINFDKVRQQTLRIRNMPMRRRLTS